MKHTKKIENIYAELYTNPNTGLTDNQISEIYKTKGYNKFDEEKKETIFEKVLHHMKDFTTIILFVAVGIAVYLGFADDHGFLDAITIFTIIIINFIVSIKQELGAEKALEALKKLNAHMTVVIRNGETQMIDAVKLVPGDILVLEAGNMIPADARLIESTNLKVDESSLTGESVPSEKDANLIVDEKAGIGDQDNMIFSGCLITNGNAKAVVVATGMYTEIGKIAGLLNNTTKLRTPLQKKMDKLGQIICLIAILAGSTLFLMQYFSEPLAYVLLNSVALAVAVIPECLPVIVTVTLAFGVGNMAKKNAIIRKITAVETLGSASVICSDKTGTLTMNKMTIQKIWHVRHEPKNVCDELNHDERFMLEIMGLASNATIEVIDGVTREIGDPTETAIIRLLREKHIEKKSLNAIYPEVFEIPFDSERKLMTTVHETKEKKYITITKGAVDRIPVDPNSFDKEKAKRIHDEFAGKALRVIAVGFKHYDELPEVLDSNELERDLIFAGFIGMIDPPRAESTLAVKTAKEAGIRTIMITGDHAITATAIAKEIGIHQEGDKVITGVELAEMSQDELEKDVKNISVYARVTPEDKIRIVKAWQKHGEVVAMTGDGVNDAPALKAADVGIAMGSGTDVSKSASAIILTDDNFASIVSAVAEGRRVYDNIRKVIHSLIPCNISEIFTMLIAISLGWGTPLVAIQLLFINVIADGIPDLCMCREKLEADAMKRKPINKKTSIFADGLGWRITVIAALFVIISLIGYYVGKFVTISSVVAPSHAVGVTITYLVCAYSSVVNISNVRSFNQSIFKIGFTTNKLLFAGICFSLTLITMTALIPGVQEIFSTVPLSIEHWILVIGLSLTPLLVVEIQKMFIRKNLSKKTSVA